MLCPKCGADVPDDRAECPICFAPLTPDSGPTPNYQNPGSSGQTAAPAQGGQPVGLQAQPAYMPPTQMGGGIPGLRVEDSEPAANYMTGNQQSAPELGGGGPNRVSLTGDVYESIPAPPPPRSAYPSGTPSGAPPRPGMPPMPQRPGGPPGAPIPARRSGTGPTVSSHAEKKGMSTGCMVFLVIGLVVLIGGGAGGFWFWQQMRSPKVTVIRMLMAWQLKDGKGMAATLDVPADQADLIAAVLTRKSEQAEIKSYKIGEEKIDGDNATVAVTIDAQVAGPSGAQQSVPVEMKLKRVNGEWKISGQSGGAMGLGGGMGGASMGAGGQSSGSGRRSRGRRSSR